MGLLKHMKKALGGKSKKQPTSDVVDVLSDPLQDPLASSSAPWTAADVSGYGYEPEPLGAEGPLAPTILPDLNGATPWSATGTRMPTGGAKSTRPTIGVGGTRLAEALIDKAPESSRAGPQAALAMGKRRGMGGEELAHAVVSRNPRMFEETEAQPTRRLGRFGL